VINYTTLIVIRKLESANTNFIVNLAFCEIKAT